MKSHSSRLASLNMSFAVWATRRFGSMGAFYLFAIWSLLPLVPALAHFKDSILYVSSGVIQLVALPLLMVGGIVLNQRTEERAESDHITILKEFQEIRQIHAEMRAMLDDVHRMATEIHRINVEANLRDQAGPAR